MVGDEQTNHAIARAVLEVLADCLSDPLRLMQTDQTSVVLTRDALGVLGEKASSQHALPKGDRHREMREAHQEVIEGPFLPELAQLGLEHADVERSEPAGLVDGAQHVLDDELREVKRAVPRGRRVAPLSRNPGVGRVPVNASPI